MVFSDDGWPESDMFERGMLGLKRPGDETGVLLAVRCGICEAIGGRKGWS